METTNIGVSRDEIQGIVKILSVLLADETVLYTRTRNYHWNVTGLQFRTLHEMFEEQYVILAGKIGRRRRRELKHTKVCMGMRQEERRVQLALPV